MASGTDDIDTTMTRLQHSIANKGANQSGAASRCNSTIPRKGGLEPPNDSDLADDAFVGLPVEVSQFDENAGTMGLAPVRVPGRPVFASPGRVGSR